MNANFINFQVIIDFFVQKSSTGGEPPIFADVLMQNLGLLIIIALLYLVSFVGIVGIWRKVYGEKKLWKAFIPFYNLFKLFRSVNLNPYLSIMIIIPIVGMIPLMIFHACIPRAFNIKEGYYVALAIFFPYVILPMVGFSAKYEFQYVKGKNIPFKDSFRIPTPGEKNYDIVYSPNEVGAIGSQVSRAAALNSARNEELRREAEQRAAEEKAKKEAEEREKAMRKNSKEDEEEEATVEVVYDIFDNDNEHEHTAENASQTAENPPANGTEPPVINL